MFWPILAENLHFPEGLRWFCETACGGVGIEQSSRLLEQALLAVGLIWRSNTPSGPPSRGGFSTITAVSHLFRGTGQSLRKDETQKRKRMGPGKLQVKKTKTNYGVAAKEKLRQQELFLAQENEGVRKLRKRTTRAQEKLEVRENEKRTRLQIYLVFFPVRGQYTNFVELRPPNV